MAGFTLLTSARCSWLSRSAHRVLSSQFLVLCRLKPSLVVELTRELLEVVGSVSGIRSRAGMFTCVVSQQPPSHRPRKPWCVLTLCSGSGVGHW